VVTGCLAQRYGESLAADLPEADLVVGFQVREQGDGGNEQGVWEQGVFDGVTTMRMGSLASTQGSRKQCACCRRP
jgi:hypothetical protein